jgi:hypothetical protein
VSAGRRAAGREPQAGPGCGRLLCRSAGLELDDWQEMVLVDSLRQDRDGAVAVVRGRRRPVPAEREGRTARGAPVDGAVRAEASRCRSTRATSSTRRWRRSAGCSSDRGHARAARAGQAVIAVAWRGGHRALAAWASGPRIRYRTRTKGGGRGFTGDCLYLDEAMIISEAMHGALLPTLSARKNPQVWYTGSAGRPARARAWRRLRRVRERGRAAATRRSATSSGRSTSTTPTR